ncbi:MAG: putative head morphosis protein of bacteriophage [Burkholderiaceae bacterium]|nr:putative head morphosis protein of bacteriophage [Burkholderiaceae bacterium]
MPEPVDLAYCMKLPPKEAIAYLTGKGYAITWDWEDLWQQAHAKAFTVAKVAKLDILQDIRDVLQHALTEGQTAAWFEKELTPVLKAKGWWGEQEQRNPDTGELEQVQLGSPWRLETIYRANTQTAYMAGRYAEQIENVDNRPFWQYIAVMDGRTRPAHRALHGLAFRFDDPFWQSFYPPNGWNCRCRVTTLSGGDLTRDRVKPSRSDGMLGSTQKLVSKKTGELREVATYSARHPDDPSGKRRLIVSPDVGWSHNPGAAWKPETARYTGNLTELAKRELQ